MDFINPDFPKSYQEILRQSQHVVISGQPSHIFKDNGKDFFFFDCEPAIDMPFFVVRALVRTIPCVGNDHVPEIFRGTYPAISGISRENNDEYIFPLITELGFNMRPDTTTTINW